MKRRKSRYSRSCYLCQLLKSGKRAVLKNKQIRKNRPFGRFDIFFILGIDLHDKLCYNKHHTKRRRIGVRLHPLISSVVGHLTDLVQWLLSCSIFCIFVKPFSVRWQRDWRLDLFHGDISYLLTKVSIYPCTLKTESMRATPEKVS